MNKNLKSLLIWGIITLGAAGTLYAATILQIPTKPANHNAYLSELILGEKDITQTLTLEQTTQDRLIIPEKLIAGERNNTIESSATFAIIAGGQLNTIGNNAENAIIGAGRTNTINSRNSIIGAGRVNTIAENAEGSIIAGGSQNSVSSPYTSIGGGDSNQIQADNSTIPGGQLNQITAKDSFAAGEHINIGQEGTFARSDMDMSYALFWTTNLTPAKDHTFLVRSLNGMAINTGSTPAGVNVHVAWAVQLDGQNLLNGACTAPLAGTFEVKEGCFYYCDGTYRQSLNVAFNEGNADGQTCNHVSRCSFDGIKLRPGDQVTAYKVQRAANCETQKKTIKCGETGAFDDPAYPYSYCMPRDATDVNTIINVYHP